MQKKRKGYDKEYAYHQNSSKSNPNSETKTEEHTQTQNTYYNKYEETKYYKDATKTYQVSGGIKYRLAKVSMHLQTMPFINIIRSIIWIGIGGYPLLSFFKTTDLNELLIYYAGLFLLYCLRKAILEITTGLLFIGLFIFLVDGKGMYAMISILMIFVLNAVMMLLFPYDYTS
jgi:hypothetical protein